MHQRAACWQLLRLYGILHCQLSPPHLNPKLSQQAWGACASVREPSVRRSVPLVEQGSVRGSSATGSGKPTDAHAPGVKTMQDLESYPREFLMKRLLAFVGIVIGCEFAPPVSCAQYHRLSAGLSYACLTQSVRLERAVGW